MVAREDLAESASPELNARVGSQYDLSDMPLLFADRDNRIGEIWDEEEPTIPELEAMLRHDKSIALYQAMSLPIRGASWSVESPDGDAETTRRIHEALERADIRRVIGQMTWAFVTRRTYHEKVWTQDERTGWFVFEDDGIEWRPPQGCVLLRDVETGKEEGFKQLVLSPLIQTRRMQQASEDGYVSIPRQYAVVYIHNQTRNPIVGVSDFEVAHWCYTQKQKLYFLWFQYCEGAALPRTVVHAKDPESGAKAVQVLAQLKNSGVAAIPEQWFTQIQSLDVSGRGSSDFQQAITNLENLAAESVLAGFLTLTTAASQNAIGSYALSADQSDFFLQALQAAADEISEVITRKIVRDLVQYNIPGLKREQMPRFHIGPISEKDAAPSLELFKQIVAAPRGSSNVPASFIDQLTLRVARFLDMDPKAVAEDLEQMRKQDAQQPPPVAQPVPPVNQPPKQPQTASPRPVAGAAAQAAKERAQAQQQGEEGTRG